MRLLREIADFVRMRWEMRFADFSRAPWRLLRFELQGGTAERDWEVRPADTRDGSLQRIERARNISQQTLSDAITMRRLLLAALPAVESAVLRGFRPSGAREPPRSGDHGLHRQGSSQRSFCELPGDAGEVVWVSFVPEQ
jgi:hypothetical protein